MKLRNKKTGEIGNFYYGYTNELCVSWQKDDGFWEKQEYNSLAELNEEWEDASEEPKDYWFIDPEILIACESTNPLLCDKKVAIETMKQIGNYFETREEAEKAVGKLKAWQRLKGKGFRFIGKTYETDKRFGSIFYKVDDDTYSEDIIHDLDLLFGGEE